MDQGHKTIREFRLTRSWHLTVFLKRLAIRLLVATAIFVLTALSLAAQSKYENRRIDLVDISFGTVEPDPIFAEPYRKIIRNLIGPTYSITKIHDSILALYNTKLIATVTVTATVINKEGVALLYLIKRKPRVEKVSIVVGKSVGDKVTEQELLFKLNILTTGATITDQTLRNNADVILDYLRERGFYQSAVKYSQQPLAGDNEVGVVFDVDPNDQAKVESFKINIVGLDTAAVPKKLELEPGTTFSRDRLTKDLATIRRSLREKDFIAPELEEPRVSYDREKNAITIELNGKVGPKVNVTLETEKEKIGDSTLTKLLPIKREGSLDYAAIVEGERRLETYYQEQGYFFADVTPRCSVDPPITDGQTVPIPNNTEFLCSALGSSELLNRTVDVSYDVSLNRKLRLVTMRLRGIENISVGDIRALTIDDLRPVLETQEANALGVIPLFGYGRGYTSLNTLEADASTIASIVSELGYLDAQVRVNQGVAPNGEDLIITFQVDPGPLTEIGSIKVTGNSAFTRDELLAQLPELSGKPFSRAKFRNSVRKLAEFYSREGYYNARVSYSTSDRADDPKAEKRIADLEFKIENEDKRVMIGRVLVSGNENTKPSAILKAAAVKSGEYLRATDVYSTEQNLYSTDAFDRVEVKPVPAGSAASGDKVSDVVINVNEQAPRLITYGGGFSTDLGVNGFFDIRHVNLLGNLWQGGARVRVSQRQQLVQFDFVNPRFIADGEKKFAPLTISAEYQRDSTVTRFFRSAFDKGTFGIVQRIDANGNPVDVFGNNAGSPTINRLTLSAETSRTLSRKDRSIIFARYRFEDVRLVNIESLLIKDLIRPDARVRISGFGFTFVRDTRENCSVKTSLLELIAKGEPGDRCRYNASDPTGGTYLTAEYNVSLPQLGANIGFNKLQLSYNAYYTIRKLKNTTFAGRAILGLAHVFSSANRFTDPNFAGLNGILPISERFFGGGSNTIRGFDFEEAGPRVAVVPQGTFLNSSGNQVYLDPFTIPFGGNALAVVNLEARVPLTKSIRAVPFYDGGNVFRRVGDIFNPPDVPPNDVLRQNLRALWTHTVGLGLRLKTPVGGEFGVDYGYLLNPPRFLIPQSVGPNAIYQLRRDQIHFRFSQAF